MHLNAILAYLSLTILQALASPHPSAINTVNLITSASPSTSTGSIPAVPCYLPLGDNPPTDCTYVYIINPVSQTVDFYVWSPYCGMQALAIRGLPLKLDNIIDSRKTPLAHNISVHIAATNNEWCSYIWYNGGYVLPLSTAALQSNGRVIGWSSFPSCEAAFPLVDVTKKVWCVDTFICGDSDKAVLVMSNKVDF